MRKSNLKILALTAALIMPLSSCKETIIYVTPEVTPNGDIKTPIELSVGGVDGAVESSTTRAVITDDQSKTYKAFDKNTKIFMVMKSTYGLDDYQGSKKDKYTVCRGDVDASTTSIKFTSLNQKYWDDAHARSSQLDIWAYAQQANWNTCTFQVPDPNWTSGQDVQSEYKSETYYTETEAIDKSPYPWIEHEYKSDGTGNKGSKGAIYPCIMNWYASHYIESTYGENQYKQDASSVQYQDLMFSNNLTKHGDDDNRLKFGSKTTGKFDTGEMKFYHAMSKLTIQIIEGDGFDKTSANKANDFNFASGKNVKLTNFNMKGTFNIKDGEFQQVESLTVPFIASSTSTSETGESPNIKTTTIHTLQALAVPNINDFLSQHSASDTKSRFVSSNSDANNIMMEFTIDNNTYKITSKQLYNALHGKTGATETTSGIIPLEAGKNYIFTFVVGKTKIEHLTATVAQWEDVEAATVEPKINVTATYGYTVAQGGTGVSSFTNNYDLFRSTTKATGYDEDANSENGINPAARYTSSSWDKTIYWPDHQTHYFFRGVYPLVGTAANGTTLPNEAVTTVNSNDVIAVANAKYTAATYPSDLAIAIPRGTTTGTYDETCKETGHTAQEGICATEGVINMNFEYAMSKVEVRLKSSKTDAAHIALTKDNTKVEIIGAYNKARIKLSDGLHDAYVNTDKGDYELSNLETTVSDFLVTTLDAIVPQVIDDDVVFRITYTNNDNGTPGDTSDDLVDVYECKVKLINEKGTSTPVSEWKHGKHYIYELDLNKTEINVTATIKNWETVNASGNIWF